MGLALGCLPSPPIQPLLLVVHWYCWCCCALLCVAQFFSSILGATILGEVLTYMHLVGGFFLIGGLVVVLYSRSREGQEARRAANLQVILKAQQQADADADADANADPERQTILLLDSVHAHRIDGLDAQQHLHVHSVQHESRLSVADALLPLTADDADHDPSAYPTAHSRSEWLHPHVHRGSIDGFHVDQGFDLEETARAEAQAQAASRATTSTPRAPPPRPASPSRAAPTQGKIATPHAASTTATTKNEKDVNPFEAPAAAASLDSNPFDV